MTKRNFDRFKKQFTKWQKAFSLGEYSVSFKLKKFPDRFAEIDIDAEGCIATVYVNETEKWTNESIELVAKHEATHLLMARFSEIARRRFLDEDELHNEEERVVCILEKLL
jgi:hypothetical protein